MPRLKDVLFKKIEEQRPRVTRLLKEFGRVELDRVSIAQAIGGVRGVKCLVSDISYLDPEEGVRFRGKTIAETFAALPRVPGSEYPFVEGFWYFLLTGEVPTMDQTLQVVKDFQARRPVPGYVFEALRAMPRDLHPMAMLSAAVVVMQRESLFSRRYNEGMSKGDLWDPMYEDSCNLLARLPAIAAFIYRLKYKGDTPIPSDPELDLGGDFAHMMGIAPPYDDVARMYFILHSDHESGNVSTHTTRLVASALADAYYSFSAGVNGLSGPLHGLANQEVLRWIQGKMEKLDGRIPTEEELAAYLWETLNSGQVIPGYGHAVLRRTDPRFEAQMEFCEKYLPDDKLYRLVKMLYKVAPNVLREHGKARNPWPNVDAQSGVIQWHYGITQYEYYTVLFAVGRAIGVLANIIWDRALGYPLERPKSVTLDMMEDVAGIR
ncbi:MULTISPECIES: citrate (Si)-synthase [Syntrophotalea]|uniref:citrate synthase (unknown stereospecificity) n=1 Tax=Syntrophotalea acetylenica TaxID=29542 RepID=A0A1L3GCM5_SYNAC|nr:citrate (Si)-synthase [Syntrophotalea acetylenica]APG23599.1 type I citrate synthase [Syntrophotalea acetylenica]APG44176.1 type I citrate synthase [Syntrophotalea acetylenica]MDY0261148.1 citrate (Si)-synthase [Syntrophotalea acetylenica]